MGDVTDGGAEAEGTPEQRIYGCSKRSLGRVV
jgi:hypothetical protein